jgi:2-polyprenyl-3-methyl-5-hydroxy-6-metoxy-1,4-benzoquinol methylase
MKRTKSHSQEREPILERILKQIRFIAVRPFVKKESNVLDLGCGYDGEFLKSISSKIRSGIGYDISVKRARVAKNVNLFPKHINNKLHLSKSSFDLITSLAVIEHLDRVQDVLNISYKALKKDGMLVITTPNPKGKFILEILSFKLKLINQREISDHKHYFSKKELKRMLKLAGFKNNKIKISYFWFWCNILAIATK